MKSSFSSPEYTSGVTSEVRQPGPNTEDRTWGEFATDVAIDALGRPVVGALRTGAQIWRGLEDDPRGLGAQVEQGLGAIDERLQEERSDRARALDTLSLDARGDERSYWREPVAGALHVALPSVPYAAAAIATAGGSLAARGATAAGMGVFGAGEAVNDLRTYTDTEPLTELQKSPVFQKLYREYNGDELAARNALFKEMLDPKSQAVNFLVNTLEVPAFRMGMRPGSAAMRIVDRAKAAGQGAVVGAAQGAAEGGTEAYIEQLGQVRAGQQQAIDTDQITSGIMSGAVFGGPMAAFHAVAPQYKVPPTTSQKFGQHVEDFIALREGRATPLGTTEQSVASQQINPEQEPPVPPQTPPPGEEIVAPPLGPPNRYGPHLPTEQYGPPNMYGPFEPRGFRNVREEPFGPDLQPPEVPAGPRVWSSHDHGFTAPVRVTEQAPVWQDGQWMQPVSYTNPRTGQVRSLLAPVSELQELYGPPDQRPPAAPPVQPPVQPPAPQFPELGRPSIPAAEEFGAEDPYAEQFGPEYLGPQYGPERPTDQMLDVDYDLVRAGIALWDEDTRTKIANKLEAIAQERPPTVEDIPGVLRNQLNENQHAALVDALAWYPADTIATIRQSPRGLTTSPVLQDLQERMRQQREQQRQAEEQPPAALDVAEQLVGVPYRRGVEATQQERDLVEDIFHYKQAKTPPYSSWLKLHRRALAADQRRADAGIPPADFLGSFDQKTLRFVEGEPGSFVEMLGEPKTAAQARRNVTAALPEQRAQGARRRAEVQQEMRRVMQRRQTVGQQIRARREAERQEREAARERREWRPPPGQRPVLTQDEQILANAVAAYNKRARDAREAPLMTKEKRLDLEVERRNLERRVVAFNETAAARKLEPLTVEPHGLLHTVKRPTKTQEREQRRLTVQKEFRETAQQLADMAERGEGRWIERQFTPEEARYVEQGEPWQMRSARRTEPIAGKPGWSRVWEPGMFVDGKVSPEARQLARRLENLQTAVHRVIGGRDYTVSTALTPEFTEYLSRLGLMKTPAQREVEATEVRMLSDAIGQQLQARLRSVLAQRGVTGLPAARLIRTVSKSFQNETTGKKTWHRRDIKAYVDRLFGRGKDGKLRWIGTGQAPGRLSGVVQADRDAWNALTAREKDELRQQGIDQLVVEPREIEEIVRDIVAKHESLARERVAVGRRPTQMIAPALPADRTSTPVKKKGGRYVPDIEERPFGGYSIPTPLEAVRRARAHLAAEKGRKTQRAATGKMGEEGTRGDQFRDRERIAKDTLLQVMKTRLGEGKRYDNFIERLKKRTVTVKPDKERGEQRVHNVSLLSMPRMPDALKSDRPWTDTDPRWDALYRWEDDVQAWLGGKEAKVDAAEKLHGDLNHILRRIDQEFARHVKTNLRGEGSITWHLPKKIWDQNQQKYIFRAGKSDPNAAYYNFANDLQKMAEELRYMLVGLGRLAPEKGQQVIKRTAEPEPVRRGGVTRERLAQLRREAAGAPKAVEGAVPLAQRIRSIFRIQSGRRGEGMAAAQSKIRSASYIEEFGRYTTPLDKYMQDFIQKLENLKLGDEGMRLIEEQRQERNREAAEARRTLSREELGVERVYPEETELPGGARALQTGEYTQAEFAEDTAASDVAGFKAIQEAGRLEVDPETGRMIAPTVEPTAAAGMIKGARRAAETRSINIEEDRAIANIDAKLRQEYDQHVRALRLHRQGIPTSIGKGRKFIADGKRERLMLPPYYSVKALDEAIEQLDGPEPFTSPLISSPETTATAIDRARLLIAEGHAGSIPTEFVTPEFMNQLAAITADTKVYYAPREAVTNYGHQAWAYYQAADDRILISNDVSAAEFVQAALHESVHAATERSLLTDPEFRDQVTQLMGLAAAYAKRRGVNLKSPPRDLYGLTDQGEFITELATNEEFRQYLFRVPAPHNPVIQGVKNVLNAAYHAIRQTLRKVFGNAKDGDTALDVLFYDQSTVLGQADKLFKRKMAELTREGRPSIDVLKQRFRELGPHRKYMGLSDGARAVRDTMGNMFDRAAFQLNQVRKEDRGVGMGWRTGFDVTKVGGEEFKEMMSGLFRTFEEMKGKETNIRDADKQEINELATIWLKWSKEGRKEAGDFMIDEGMHTAWADAPIGELGPEYLDQETGERKRDRVGKNAHIDPTSLRDEQVVYEHKKMMDRLADISGKLTQFREFRDRVYAFTAKREEEIRRQRYRDAFAVTDFIPANIEGKQLDRLLDAFVRWTDPDLKVTPDDMRVFRAAGINLNNKQLIEHKDLVASTKELSKIIGPYSPFTRYGDWALSGRFKIDRPKNALLLKEDIDETTGEPIDDARFVFPTIDEAREHVRKVTDDLGIAQLEGGPIWIDTTTGQRPRVPDKREKDKERIATEREIENHPNAEKIEQYYYVTFQPKLLTMEPDQFTADQNMRAFKEKFGDKLDITKPKDVFRHDGRQNEQYVSTKLQSVLNFIRSQAAFQKLDKHEQAAIDRTYNLAAEQFVLRRGFKQRQLPRNYVMGPTNHVLASLDDYSETSSRYLGKVEFGSQLKKQQEDLRQYLKETEYNQGNRSSLAEQRAFNAMQRRIHNPTRNPHETFISRQLDRGMRLTMLDKLPTPAYFVVNATETGTVGVPIMSGRHSAVNVVRTMARHYGIAGTFVRFAKAAKNDLKQALKRGVKMTNFLDLFNDAIDQAEAKGRTQFAAGLKDLMQQAARRNHFDSRASLEYQNAFPTSRKKIDAMLDWGQGVFQAINTAIENMNRFVTLSTAYDLEMRRLMDVANGKKKEHKAGERNYTAEQRHQAAADYAMDTLHQVNGIYANYNAPEFFTREGPLGMLGPVIFQFKKWPQRITMIYMRTALGMLKGMGQDWVQGRKMRPEYREAARQFGFMVGMAALVAGALGMPSEPLSVTVNLGFMMGLWNYNWDDMQAGFRAWLAKKTNRDLAEFIAHGPLNYFTGIDFAGRMGQSQMWAFGSPASNKQRDLYASLMGLLGGATLNTGVEVVQGLNKGTEAISAYMAGADDVAWKKAGESVRHLFLIRFVADALKSVAGAEGTELASGRKLGPDLSLGERAATAAGFTPTRVSEAREARAAITSMQKRITDQRKRYIDLFASSPPGAQRQSVWETIQRNWNSAYPEHEITMDDLLKAANTRRKAKAEDRNLLGIQQTKTTRALMPMAETYGYR